MVNLAIVGCGGMAHWHAQQLQKISDARVIALADPIAAQTAAFKTRYFADAAVFDGFDALAANPPDGLDAVVLVTPHTLHFPEARTALKRGWHVLVEKPMVTRSADAYELASLVRQTGKLLAITFQAPYTPEFGYLAAERDAGRLGKIQLASAYLSQGWMHATRNSWRQTPALSGGGQMYDSGAHTLNAMMWLLNDPVVDVACFYDRRGTPVDINGVVIARFQSGAMASISIGGNCPPFRNGLFIQTDRMLIETDQYGTKLEITGDGGKRIYPHIVADTRPAGGTPHLNFINALLGREKLRAPVRYGVLLSALMDAVYESADKGAVVRVNPVPDDL
jgi:predicted dehydrogenase